MKTKELIALLQKEDPTGEGEVCINNADILSVMTEAAYWDGCLQRLILNEKGRVVGAKIISSGTKIKICPYFLSDVIFDQEDLEIDYSDLPPQKAESYRKMFDAERAESIKIKNDVSKSYFVKYMTRRLCDGFKAVGGISDFEHVKPIIEKFYDDNMDHNDPFPPDLVNQLHLSVNERRKIQWDREIYVDFANGVPFFNYTMAIDY